MADEKAMIELHIETSGFGIPCYVISWRDGYLWYQRMEPCGFPEKPDEAIDPDAKCWEDFWRFVESAEWRSRYGPKGTVVCDGWGWSVQARRDGKGIASKGVLETPNNWSKFVDLLRALLDDRPFE